MFLSTGTSVSLTVWLGLEWYWTRRLRSEDTMKRSPLFLFITIATLAPGCGLLTSTSSTTADGGGSAGGGGSTGAAPTVMSNTPIDGAVGVPINGNASATFSEAMDCSSLTPETFKLTSASTASPVLGTVICAGSAAVFWPAAHLPSNSAFTATITTGAKSLGGVHLGADHGWGFTTGTVVEAGQTVNLGRAGEYAILAKAAISTVPTSAVTGNVGISPAAASFITGFSLTADATNVFSTAPQVTGKVYAANYAPPTPANLTVAVSDMLLAFTDAAGRAPDFTELGAGNIGGMTLVAGVYKWGTGLLIPTNVTLTGTPTDVWIFQVAGKLTMSSASQVVLAGGALPKNVFWQVADAVEVGTTAHLEGVVLTQTAVALRTGASLNGRLLAQTGVSIDGSTLVEPAP